MNFSKPAAYIGMRQEKPYRSFTRRLRTFLKAEGGAAAVYFVLSAPVWIGGLGLGAEVGTWYYLQQQLQSTADAVAESLAGRVGTGASPSELSGLTNTVLASNKFNFSKGTSSINFSSSGPVFVDGTTVTVRLTRNVRRLLTGFFQPGDFVITASSTAEVRRATQGCILALANSGAARLQVQASANIQVNGCEVLSNSVAPNGFSVAAGAQLSSSCARSAGNFAGPVSVTACPRPQVEAGFTLDPYVNFPEPNLSGIRCNNTSDFTWTDTSGPPDIISVNGISYIYFCNGAQLTINKNQNFPQNAIYIFEGSNSKLHIYNPYSPTFVETTFYFRNGAAASIWTPFRGVQITAPAGGPTRGMIFLGARTNTGQSNQFNIGSGSRLDGAIYFPAANVSFQASGSLTGCVQIIGSVVQLAGAWTLNGPCQFAGVRPIVASRNVRLTQ